MGFAIMDDTTLDVLSQLNYRFRPSVMKEMAALQKEFTIFSSDHPLEDSFKVLGIEPADRHERERWYNFLGDLKDYPSDLPNITGYQRVILAYEQALLPSAHINPFPPLPVYVTVHKMEEDPRVTFNFEGDRPLIFSVQTYRILSIPTKPSHVAKQEAAAAARERRENKGKEEKE